ncbi:YciI family protein [Actinomadura sp. DC4]|uniref:YciI family protein n=1 Tax=Actinomadura sp. DC4 TaxID=3055069 RepID=UPI0025B20120|nr:YciI family protein [Actinomadura sp. DC4]MDN3354284.1 YciI family protein [Actinomadura sp. DC4]
MKYLVAVYGNACEAWRRETAWSRRYFETGELLGAYDLADPVTARLVRRENGAPVVTDGPYLEAREHLVTFYLLDCENEERAHEIAADLPRADTVPAEVWPILHGSAADLV